MFSGVSPKDKKNTITSPVSRSNSALLSPRTVSRSPSRGSNESNENRATNQKKKHISGSLIVPSTFDKKQQEKKIKDIMAQNSLLKRRTTNRSSERSQTQTSQIMLSNVRTNED